MRREQTKLIWVTGVIFLVALFSATGMAGLGIDALIGAAIFTLILTPMAWWILKP